MQSYSQSCVFLTGLVCLTVVAGCGLMNPLPPERENHMDQIFGALQIRGKTEREAALAEACRQSAEAGDGFAVLQGLPRIESAELRNELAEECARALHGAGKREAASEVADLISKQEQREELIDEFEE